MLLSCRGFLFLLAHPSLPSLPFLPYLLSSDLLFPVLLLSPFGILHAFLAHCLFAVLQTHHPSCYSFTLFVSHSHSPGKKFDLRVYALVTTYNPLTIWLHRSGFARFTTMRFTMNMDNIADTCIA